MIGVAGSVTRAAATDRRTAAVPRTSRRRRLPPTTSTEAEPRLRNPNRKPPALVTGPAASPADSSTRAKVQRPSRPKKRNSKRNTPPRQRELPKIRVTNLDGHVTPH